MCCYPHDRPGSEEKERVENAESAEERKEESGAEKGEEKVTTDGDMVEASETKSADEERQRREREEEENDPVRVASRKPLEMDAKIGVLEKIHGVLNLEKVLGLLAAILPQDTNVRFKVHVCTLL